MNRTSNSLSIPNIVALVCAIAIALTFFALPWIDLLGVNLTAYQILSETEALEIPPETEALEILSETEALETLSEEEALEILSATESLVSAGLAILWLIPISMVVAGIASLWGLLRKSDQNLSAKISFGAGIYGILFYVNFFLQVDRSILDIIIGLPGFGFWLALIANIGLIVQIFIPSESSTTTQSDASNYENYELKAGEPILQAKGLVKRYGQVTALDGADFELYPGEILAVIGDNGAGKSTLIKALSGAIQPDEGEILLNGRPIRFSGPSDARSHGIETVYQTLAVAPSMNIMENLFLGRETRRPGIPGSVFGMIDKEKMLEDATSYMQDLQFRIQSMTEPVSNLSGGQRQGVAVARSAFAKNVVIMDEPTAALGVKESGMVLDLIRKVRDKGLPVILISHNMPHVWELADRIHIQRLGRRAAVIKPDEYSMSDGVAIMTGAKEI